MFFICGLNNLKNKIVNNKEILDIYKMAEKHWSRPAWLCFILGWNTTNRGLCWYFANEASEYYDSNYFEKDWYPYRTTQVGSYHFRTRKERLQAIRNVIKDLENGR
jgi:hypothetical protein